MSRSTRAAALTAAALALATPALAQQSTTRGLDVGLHLTGSSLDVEGGSERSDGGGAGLLIGYGVNRTLMPFLQIEGAGFAVDDAAIEGDWTMAHVDLGVRFHFANPARTWVPFLQVALTGRAVSVDRARIDGDQFDEVTFNGGGLSVGGGVTLYPWETVGIELQLVATDGEFTEVESGNVTVSGLDIDASSGRLSVGMSWWP